MARNDQVAGWLAPFRECLGRVTLESVQRSAGFSFGRRREWVRRGRIRPALKAIFTTKSTKDTKGVSGWCVFGIVSRELLWGMYSEVSGFLFACRLRWASGSGAAPGKRLPNSTESTSARPVPSSPSSAHEPLFRKPPRRPSPPPAPSSPARQFPPAAAEVSGMFCSDLLCWRWCKSAPSVGAKLRVEG
jgi:hypothetical protein